jgi:hypothetical protein
MRLAKKQDQKFMSLNASNATATPEWRGEQDTTSSGLKAPRQSGGAILMHEISRQEVRTGTFKREIDGRQVGISTRP